MYQVATCQNPRCAQKVRIPSTMPAGKRLLCPHCKTIFFYECLSGDDTGKKVLPDQQAAATVSVGGEDSQKSGVSEAIQDPGATQSWGKDNPPISTKNPQASEKVSQPRSIGRFQIRQLLGEGAFGKVYEAYDPQLDRAVALKVAKIDGGDRERRTRRFLREAKAAANLRHPHIVPLYEFGQEGDQFYIVSAYIRGKSLQEALKEQKGKPLEEARAVRIVRRLAEALAYAHAQGIVHRDIKPANVMLDEKDDPMLMDFGLAARQEEAEKLTHEGTVLGTPLYMAPEQASGQSGEALPASDQYSLGVMLFELLTGQVPFKGKPELVMFHHMKSDPPSPTTLNRRLSRDLETITLKCLEKDAGRRFADEIALAEDLRRFQDGEPIQAIRISRWRRLGRWCKRNPAISTLAILVVLSLVAGTSVSTYLAFEANEARAGADEAALQARAQATRAEENEALAKEQTRRAEANEVLAKSSAELAEQNAGKAREEAEKARLQFTRASRVSGFLVGLFDANDPLGMTGYAFGPDPKQGGKLTARDVLQRGLRKIKGELKDEPESRASLLLTIGSVLRNMGQYKEARPLLEEALALRTSLPRTSAKEVAECWFHLGWLHHFAGEDTEALRCYAEAIKLAVNQPGSEEIVSHARFTTAWLLTLQENYAEAEGLFRAVLKERRQRLGTDHFDVAVAQAGLAALLLFDNDNRVESALLAQSALATFRKYHGNESLPTAIGLAQSALIDGAFKKFASAETKMLKVHELIRELFGETHPFVAWALGGLGHICQQANKYQEACGYFEKSLQVFRDGIGLDHSTAIQVADSYAPMLAQHGEYHVGAKVFDEILQQIQKRRGVNSPLYFVGLSHYASYASGARKNDKAIAIYRQALEVERNCASLGSHRRCFMIRNELGVLLHKTLPDQAERLWREVIAALDNSQKSRTFSKASEIQIQSQLNLLVGILVPQHRIGEALLLVNKLESMALSNSSLDKQVRDVCKSIRQETPRRVLEFSCASVSTLGQPASTRAELPWALLATQALRKQGLDYQFHVSVKKIPRPIREENGTLVSGDEVDEKGCYRKKIVVQLKAGVSYQMDLRSTQFDTFLRLENSQGNLVAKDDDSGGKLNARIIYTPKVTADFVCVATSYKKGAAGDFTFVLQTLEEQQQVRVYNTILLIKDLLTAQDSRDKVLKNSWAKTFPVFLQAGNTYRIDLESDKFDAYLRLEDEKGRILAKDDDGGDNLNARIYFLPKISRPLRIVVTTFEAQSIGDFTLRVSEAKASTLGGATTPP